MPRLPSRRRPSQARSHATLQVIREAALKRALAATPSITGTPVPPSLL